MKENDPSYGVVNNGCSGINSTQLRAHLTELIEKDDDVILLMIGTNNRKLPNGMVVLFHDLIDIMKRLKAMNKKVILMMANPVTSEDDHYVNRLFKQEDVNEVLKKVAMQSNVTFINYYEYIHRYMNQTGESIESLMIHGDGLHPTDKVHKLMFKHLIELLEL